MSEIDIWLKEHMAYMHMYTLTRWMVVQQYNNASFYQTIYTLYPYM